jgi:hypothetical protein
MIIPDEYRTTAEDVRRVIKREWNALGITWPMIARVEKDLFDPESMIETGATVALRGGARKITALLGAAGCGKTFEALRFAMLSFATGIYRGWAESNDDREPQFYLYEHRPRVNLYGFFKAMDVAQLNRFEPEERKKIERKSFLIIDDVGAEPTDRDGWMQANLDAIIDHRWTQRLTTVVTSNLAVADFQLRYGARVVDRIASSGGFHGCGSSSLRASHPLPDSGPMDLRIADRIYSPPPMALLRRIREEADDEHSDD